MHCSEPLFLFHWWALVGNDSIGKGKYSSRSIVFLAQMPFITFHMLGLGIPFTQFITRQIRRINVLRIAAI